MSPDGYLLLLLGAAAGGLINGLAGFGTALFALGFWLHILPPAHAVATVVVMGFVSGLQGLWIVRAAIKAEPRRLARFILPGLLGIPLGVAVLALISAEFLTITIAVFMLLYGSFFAFRRTLPKLSRTYPGVDVFIGFLGGILGGAASLSGALPTMWCAMYPWAKSETRAVLQPYNVVILGLTMVTFALTGIYDADLLKLIAIALPVTMVFAQIGITLFKRLSDNQFRRLIIGLMFVSGFILMARQLWG